MVKSSKVYIRDSGLLHALLGIEDFNQLSGHPVVGASWEGYVIENILGVMPNGMRASFYRSSGGAEIDLIIEMLGSNENWAVEIKRSTTPKVSKGFHIACEDVKPERAFVLVFGKGHYRISDKIEAVGLAEFMNLLNIRRMLE